MAKTKDEDRTVKATKKQVIKTRAVKTTKASTTAAPKAKGTPVDRTTAEKILSLLTPDEFNAIMARATPVTDKSEMPNEYIIQQGPGQYTYQTGPYTPPPPPTPAPNPSAPNINPIFANSVMDVKTPTQPIVTKAKFVKADPSELPDTYYIQQPDGSIVTVTKPQAQPVLPSTPVTPTPQAPTRPYNPALPDVYYIRQPDGSVVAVDNKTGQTSPAPANVGAIESAIVGKKA